MFMNVDALTFILSKDEWLNYTILLELLLVVIFVIQFLAHWNFSVEILAEYVSELQRWHLRILVSLTTCKDGGM